jgi:hypothetical protein
MPRTISEQKKLASINLLQRLMNMNEDQMESLIETNLTGLKKKIKEKIEESPENVKKAILNTCGDETANDLLIKKYNNLLEEINNDYVHSITTVVTGRPIRLRPYPQSIQDAFETFLKAYYFAISKHQQSNETLYRSSVKKSFENVSLMDDYEFIHENGDKKGKKERPKIN